MSQFPLPATDSTTSTIPLGFPARGPTPETLPRIEERTEHILTGLDETLEQVRREARTETLATPPELSVVIPCLDEADTVGICVRKACDAIRRLGIAGEVIVADNGSRDGSRELAAEAGARVVPVAGRGYGAALMGGIAAARGEFIIMGDADDSYDFSDLARFVERLRGGAELVQGCRLPKGGGTIMPGAMPFLHHYGNPGLTWLVQRMFGAQINDVYCGMRGFRKDLYERLDQRCTGMEFATEMIIKSTLFGARIEEIPITLYKDGRKAHRPHLRTFRDGWKTLRFFLMLSPRWTFLAPSLSLTFLGLLGYIGVYSGWQIGNARLDVHTLLIATMAILTAVQVATCGLLAKVFAGSEGLIPRDERLEHLARTFNLERCLLLSGVLIAAGSAAVLWKFNTWRLGGFSVLDYSSTMKVLIPAVAAIVLGVQSVSSSFLLSVLRLHRR